MPKGFFMYTYLILTIHVDPCSQKLLNPPDITIVTRLEETLYVEVHVHVYVYEYMYAFPS